MGTPWGKGKKYTGSKVHRFKGSQVQKFTGSQGGGKEKRLVRLRTKRKLRGTTSIRFFTLVLLRVLCGEKPLSAADVFISLRANGRSRDVLLITVH